MCLPRVVFLLTTYQHPSWALFPDAAKAMNMTMPSSYYVLLCIYEQHDTSLLMIHFGELTLNPNTL